MENVKTETKTEEIKEENLLRFTTKTIKFTEIMTLSRLVFDFIRISGANEKILDTKTFKEDKFDWRELFFVGQEVILKDEETMRSFLKIVEFSTGKDFDDDFTVENMKVIKQVLNFLSEVGVLNFLKQMTMILVNWTKG